MQCRIGKIYGKRTWHNNLRLNFPILWHSKFTFTPELQYKRTICAFLSKANCFTRELEWHALDSWQSVRSTKQDFITCLRSTVIDDTDVSVLTSNLLFSTNQEGSLDFCNPFEGLAPTKTTWKWTTFCPNLQLLDTDVAKAENWLTLELEAMPSAIATFALALE